MELLKPKRIVKQSVEGYELVVEARSKLFNAADQTADAAGPAPAAVDVSVERAAVEAVVNARSVVELNIQHFRELYDKLVLQEGERLGALSASFVHNRPEQRGDVPGKRRFNKCKCVGHAICGCRCPGHIELHLTTFKNNLGAVKAVVDTFAKELGIDN